MSATDIQAQVVINEFLADLDTSQDESLHEWVELYNTSVDTAIDVTGYVLSDEKDNQLHITLDHVDKTDLSLEPESYLVIYRRSAKFSLNNSQDTIYLFDSTQSAHPIDSVSYSKTKTGLSWGRIPDGIGLFTNFLEPTPGKENLPLPTITPTQTTRPSPLPKKNVDINSQTTPSPTLKQTITIKPAQPTSIEDTLIELNPKEPVRAIAKVTNISSRSAILGLDSLTASRTAESTDSPFVKEIDTSTPNSSYIYFSISALCFLSLAGWRLIRHIKQVDP